MLRTVFGLGYNDTTKQICNKNRILRFEDEHILSCLQFAKTLTSDDSPLNILNIHPREENKGTRTGTKMNLQLFNSKRTNTRNNSPYQVPFLWNQLHYSAQNLSSKALTNFIKCQLTCLYVWLSSYPLFSSILHLFPSPFIERSRTRLKQGHLKTLYWTVVTLFIPCTIDGLLAQVKVTWAGKK